MPDIHAAPIYGEDFSENNMIDSINGDVYAAGIKYDLRGWLDMGSKEWQNMPEGEKLKAYTAAKKAGWTDSSLSAIMIKSFIHLTENDLNMVFEKYREMEKLSDI